MAALEKWLKEAATEQEEVTKEFEAANTALNETLSAIQAETVDLEKKKATHYEAVEKAISSKNPGVQLDVNRIMEVSFF